MHSAPILHQIASGFQWEHLHICVWLVVHVQFRSQPPMNVKTVFEFQQLCLLVVASCHHTLLPVGSCTCQPCVLCRALSTQSLACQRLSPLYSARVPLSFAVKCLPVFRCSCLYMCSYSSICVTVLSLDAACFTVLACVLIMIHATGDSCKQVRCMHLNDALRSNIKGSSCQHLNLDQRHAWPSLCHAPQLRMA